MNQSTIQTVLEKVYRKDENLLLTHFTETYFKKNKQLLLLLFHMKLNQAILYTPKDWIQQPYVNTDELSEFLDIIFDMKTNKNIELTEATLTEESEDIIILSNLLKIETIEDQRIVFSKGYYTDNPMKIKDDAGKVAYIGTMLDDTLCRQLQKIIHQHIQPIEKPAITTENPQPSPVKVQQKDTNNTVITPTTESKPIVSEDTKSPEKEERFHISKKKYKLLIALVSIAILLALGLIVYSYIHVTSHHKTTESLAQTTTFTKTDLDTSAASNTTQKNYSIKYKQYGIDISHYNGDVVSLLNNKDSIHFVICKATQGADYVDPTFKNNWTQLAQKKIIRGAYHFYEVGVDPVQQAEHFLDVVGTLATNDIAPVLDFEEDSFNGKSIDKATLQHNLLQFLEYITSKTKRSPIIYVDRDYANQYLDNPEFANYRLYLASWTTAAFPELPTTWQEKGLFLWQKSDSYSIDNTKDDLDVFFGTLDELTAN